MNIYLFILLVVLLLVVLLWLSTARFVTPESGKITAISSLGTIVKVIGNQLPEQTTKYYGADQDNKLPIRIDEKDTTWFFVIWPYRIASFDYRRKRFKTLKEVREEKGEIRWQPTEREYSEKGGYGKILPNGPDTIVLGEWIDRNKKSLFLLEQDGIELPFSSKDGVTGQAKASITYVIWNYARAISSMYDIKSVPEKAVKDYYRNWSGNAEYEILKKTTFDAAQHIEGQQDDFLIRLNKEVYETGIVIKDIFIEDFFINQESRDAIELQEQIKAGEKRAMAKQFEIDQDIAKIELTAKATANGSELIAAAEAKNINVKGLAENTVAADREAKLNEIAIDRTQREVDIQLTANGKIIDKMIKYKKTEDVTEVESMKALSNLPGTLFITGQKGNMSQFDDKMVERITANILTPKKKEVPNEK